MTVPIDDGAPDDTRSGADIAEAIEVAEAGSRVQQVHDRGQYDKTGEAPVEHTRGDPGMTQGQVVSGPGSAGGTTSSGAEGAGSGAAQSVLGARPVDEAASDR